MARRAPLLRRPAARGRRGGRAGRPLRWPASVRRSRRCSPRVCRWAGDRARRRERVREVDARRGGGDGLRPLRRGRVDERAALDPGQRVRRLGAPDPQPQRRQLTLGLLPARRDHARLLHVPGGEPGAGPEAMFHEMSHGESFLEVLRSRFRSPASTSSTSRSRAVVQRQPRARRRPPRPVATGTSQVLVATHSPVSRAPGARILEVGPWGLRESAWDELELVGTGALPRRTAALPAAPLTPRCESHRPAALEHAGRRCLGRRASSRRDSSTAACATIASVMCRFQPRQLRTS